MKRPNWFYLYGSHFTKPFVCRVFQEKQEAITYLAEIVKGLSPTNLSDHWIEDKEALKKRFTADELRQMFLYWKQYAD